MNQKYIQRTIDQHLIQWKEDPNHMVLLVRGARQIGKTSAIRHLGVSFTHYLEVDLSERADLHSLFTPQSSPQEICNHLSAIFNTPIIDGQTLLFFDEIQACPQAISKLRYFYERMPHLHVVAAGSLLEFALEELPSFGVGRVQSIFMYPLSFQEFVYACGKKSAYDIIQQSSPTNPPHETIHTMMIELLRIFLIIGGMPQVVSEYINKGTLLSCGKILNSLVVSFRDDFSKYRKRVPFNRIDETFLSIAHQNQGKFIYSKVNSNLSAEQVKNALHTLIMAGLVYPITHSSSNGIPLGAEINEKYRRMIYFDTGLLLKVLGLNYENILLASNSQLINKGSLAETFVGCELTKSASPYEPTPLYCWHKESPNANSEVDYVISRNSEIIPIEVKAGTQGSMQSMRVFLKSKNIPYGIRTSLENFGQLPDIDIYPLYAIPFIKCRPN